MNLSTENTTHWSLARKLLFRFFACYFLIYCIPSFLNVADVISLKWLWDPAITLAGRLLIRHDFKIEYWPNGSGDTTYNYLQLFVFAVTALIASTIWGIIDRKRDGYDKEQYWLLAVLRYALALNMITYGMAKVIKVQFPDHELFRLDELVGEMSPMGLAWTYMGQSTGYNIFTGLAEAGAGCLLLFYRSRLLGALATMAVMGNVVAMNFFYDIPVKLFSSHLFLIALFITLPDIRRLTNFFVLNKPVPAGNSWHPDWQDKKRRRIYLYIKTPMVALIMGLGIYSAVSVVRGRQVPSVLFGTYEPVSFSTAAGKLPDPLLMMQQWKKMFIERDHMVIGKDSSGQLAGLYEHTDSVRHTFSIWSTSADSVSLHYHIPEDGLLLLSGQVGADSVKITLKKKDPKEYLLISRGFHWINEYPFNR
ncbi:hypothetical protein [Chitinophaga sp. 212800010-3]|uniref:hypothetical protein n=1 Tax=unclassified Chitinophaga TaxID=2619133 RepID=UPI002DE73C5A|nr:hypothetical protein [Chitinophaga sp. 212800010-3]